MCSAKGKLNLSPPMEIVPDNLIKLVESLEYPITLSFTGGEPLVYFRKHLDVLSYLVEKENIRLYIITNGLLLDERIIDILNKDTNGYVLTISVDGYKNVYEQIRRGANWERLNDNLLMLSQSTRGNKNRIFFIRYILMNKTIYCYRDFVKYAINNWDVSHIETEALLLDGTLENESLMLSTEDAKYFDEVIYEMKTKDRYRVGDNGNIIVNLDKIVLANKYQCPSCGDFCQEPFYTMSVYYNGDISPCCHSTNIFLGNISRDSIYSAWNSDAMQEIRKYVSQCKKHPTCLCNNVFINKEKYFWKNSHKEQHMNKVNRRKAYIKKKLDEYRNEHRDKNNLLFLENASIYTFDKMSIPIYSELAGGYLYRIQDYHRANELCDIILRMIPDHYDTLIKKAVIQHKMHNTSEAIDIIEKRVLTQNRAHNIAYFWLGYFYEDKDHDKTRELYEKYISLESNNTCWGHQHALEWLKTNVGNME